MHSALTLYTGQSKFGHFRTLQPAVKKMRISLLEESLLLFPEYRFFLVALTVLVILSHALFVHPVALSTNRSTTKCEYRDEYHMQFDQLAAFNRR